MGGSGDQGRRWLLAAMAVMVWALPGAALGHPVVEEAMRQVQLAELEAARATLERAEEVTDLTRDDVAQIFVLWSLIHHATGNVDDLDRSLGRLAAVDPGHEFDASVPPAIRERFASLRGESRHQPRIIMSAVRASGEIHIRATVEDDALGLVRETRIHWRPMGGEWSVADEDHVTVEAGERESVEYFVEALGLGGATVFQEGSADQPRLTSAVVPPVEGGPQTALAEGASGETPSRRGSTALWVGLGVTGAVLVGGAVVLAVLLTQPENDETELSPPLVVWP